MRREIYIFKDKQELAGRLASDFQRAVDDTKNEGRQIFIALSGGSTPRIFFEKLSKPPYDKGVFWSNVILFWGDERCVPPDDEESNFKLADDTFISKVNIPDQNVHRVIGENPPEIEVDRYAKEIQKYLPSKNGFPEFDWIFLGMGADGHTASLFPNAPPLRDMKSICVVATHPETGQKRISLAIPVINNSKRVSFLVAGEEKSKILNEILNKGDSPLPYP
ncbi:MAG: 6-phosphogluconolactonase, partial [Deltaproteobacteria bacterium]|nr:6-phosphogluconolactonase [Deltaproteobacteria bacterium]